MAGLFRQFSFNGNSNTNQSTPNKRLSIGAFCTSPGTLQDVTMDNSYAIGYRSPCVSLNPYQGNSSPASQGRSVREFEETLSSLRKENFNLRLRLYFIEESLPGYQQAQNNVDGSESIMKQLIDQKVQTEMIRKELKEKEEVLRDAATALNQMDKIHQDKTKSEAVIEELKQKIHYLEMEKDTERIKSSGELFDNILGRSNIQDNITVLQKVREYEGLLKQSEERIFNLRNELGKIDELLAKRDETIKDLEEKIKEQAFENAELAEQLEAREEDLTSIEKEKLKQEVQVQKAAMADKLCMLEEVEEKLQTTENKLAERIKVHEQACRTIQKLMITIKHQHGEITKLKQSAQTNPMHTITHNSDNVKSSELHTCALSDNDDAINEQIRLQNLIAQQGALIEQLQAEVQTKTTNLQSLVNHELWEKNREIERLTKLVNQGTQYSPNTSNEDKQLPAVHSDFQRLLAQCELDEDLRDPREHQIIEELRLELEQARQDTEIAEKWRRDCADVCTMLSNRLEELAGFLNSLLKHKDVLGALAADRRRAIRTAVDRSLDLSKSLNMTLSISGMSMCEQSLVQLSNLSEILGEAEENRTFNSHDDQELLAIETLKAENKALKRELDKRRHTDKKERRSLPLAVTENQSESEAWSEPDRLVSLARIGLDEMPSVTKELNTTNGNAVDTDSDYDALRQQNRSAAQKVRVVEQRITQLEQMLAERDERILEMQCLLVDADNRLKRENLRVMELEQAICHLPQEIEAKAQALDQVQEERERITVEARLAELQIGVLKSEMDELRQRHAQILKNAEQEQQQHRQMMENRMAQQERLHAEDLEKYWVPKDLHEQLQEELNKQQVLLRNWEQQEAESKRSLIEAEQSERNLKRKLDESSLQASKAVLERTKAVKEKRQLEQHVQELQQRLQLLGDERDGLHQQIIDLENSQKTLITDLQAKEQMGYSSEEVAQVAALSTIPTSNTSAIKVQHRGNNNSSPDLGIESDAGRVSSGVEAGKIKKSLLNNKNDILKEELSDGPIENISPKKENTEMPLATTSSTVSVVGQHDCAKVEQENAELRRKLVRTKRAFEDTYEKLRVANQKKAQIEKDIRNQILKTHNVLKTVRHNMENDL